MTSLDMHGFSVSVMNVNDSQVESLEKTIALSAWPGVQRRTPVKIDRIPDGLTPAEPIASDNPKTRQTIISICDMLVVSEAALNRLDAKLGDGDAGSTLATAARSLNGSVDRMPLADLTQLMPALGNELSQTMGGLGCDSGDLLQCHGRCLRSRATYS
jgi:dihydroxyacetone kinase